MLSLAAIERMETELAELRACLNEPAAEDADFEEVVSAAEEGIEVEITEDEKSE